MSDDFVNLAENTFDFFILSLKDLDTSPKYSLIHFYFGIEILLKARLLHLDWKLILIDPYETSYDEFKKGNFISIDLNKAVKRINKFANDEISHNAKRIFNKISKHRNKIVHFFHPDFIDKTKQIVAEEQWIAWHYLRELLAYKWNDIFSIFEEKIKFINSGIRNHKQFLENKYNIIKKSISDEIKNGTMYLKCPICSFKSSKVNKKEKYGSIFGCKVCEAEMIIVDTIDIKINCPYCESICNIASKNDEGLKIISFPYDFSRRDHKQIISKTENLHSRLTLTCININCKKKIPTNKIIQQCYKKYSPKDYDWYSEGMPYAAYCCTCQYNKPSVFYISDEWTCILCLDRGWSALFCPHCNEFVVGDANKIKNFACVRCEAQARADFENQSK